MFEQQNKVIWVINKIVDMVLLSVLWAVCSIPIVTIGASSAALYHAINKAIREDKGYARQAFFQSFRENWKQCLGLGTVLLVFSGAFLGVILFCASYSLGMFGQFYSVFSLICLLLVVLLQIHAYSLIGRFVLTNKQLFSVLVQLMGRNLLKNLMLLCLFAFAVEAVIFYPPLLLFIPAGYTFLVSVLEEPVFAKYIRVPHEEEEEEFSEEAGADQV